MENKTVVKSKRLDSLSNDSKKVISVLIGLFILVVFFSLSSDKFFTTNNLLTVALQTAVIVIIAIGQTYVIITGGIDLSIGSNIALSGIVGAMIMTAIPGPQGIVIGIIGGILSGALVGAINGLLIVYGKLPPFIATLGSMSVVRGLCLTLTNGIPISNLPPAFGFIGGGKVLGIPVPVIIMVIIAVIFGFILSKTNQGRYTYSVGSNFESTRLSGINTSKVTINVYMISGILAACGGIILAARLVSAQPTAGTGYELDAVAASVIGGASLVGGEGVILGTFIGAFVIGILRNGLNLINVSPYLQQIVIGLVIIGAVFIDRARRKSK